MSGSIDDIAKEGIALRKEAEAFSSKKEYKKAKPLYKKAWSLIKKAAEQGHAEAQFLMGDKDKYSFSDREKAVEWFRKSAKQGFGKAYDALGYFYNNGYGGLPKDDKQAFECYKKAVELGCEYAQKDYDRLKEQFLISDYDEEQAKKEKLRQEQIKLETATEIYVTCSFEERDGENLRDLMRTLSDEKAFLLSRNNLYNFMDFCGDNIKNELMADQFEDIECIEDEYGEFIIGRLFYNGKSLIIQGLTGDFEGGFSIIGDDSYKIAKSIIEILKKIKYTKIEYTMKQIKYLGQYEINELIINLGKRRQEIDEILAKRPKGKKIDEEKYYEEEYNDKDENNTRENKIIELCTFFKIEYSSLDKENLKKNYRAMIAQYHPDKVNTLADEFKELAVKKSKEINEKYEALLSYLEKKGNFVNEKPQSKEKMTFPDGAVYEGDIFDGKPHGRGKMIYPDGRIYEGDYVDGKRTKGKVTGSNGDVYEGNFVDNRYHGKGKFTFHDGRVYEGDCVNGNMHGKGKMTYADGKVNEGNYKDGKFVSSGS
jgi:hypothetical protein